MFRTCMCPITFLFKINLVLANGLVWAQVVDREAEAERGLIVLIFKGSKTAGPMEVQGRQTRAKRSRQAS